MVQNVIGGAIRDFHADLISLKDGFPQLADVEEASIQGHRFLYRRGLISDGVLGTRFERDGCRIYLEILYVAQGGNVGERTLALAPAIDLDGGGHCRVWRNVRAAWTEQGQAFKRAVMDLMDRHVDRMRTTLMSLG